MPLVTDATGNDLTYRIIGAAMEVHNEIGYGFKEEVYEKALEVKLNHMGVNSERQYQVAVEYEGEQVAIFYLDLLQCAAISGCLSQFADWDRVRTNTMSGCNFIGRKQTR